MPLSIQSILLDIPADLWPSTISAASHHAADAKIRAAEYAIIGLKLLESQNQVGSSGSNPKQFFDNVLEMQMDIIVGELKKQKVEKPENALAEYLKAIDEVIRVKARTNTNSILLRR